MLIFNYNCSKTLQNRCNFNCGESTIDYTLVSLQNNYCFLDDIVIVSTWSESDHLSYVTNCLKKLEEGNFKIDLQNCHFPITEIEWLGYKFTQTGISPLENKTTAILAIPLASKLKHLRFFLCSVHYTNKFNPNLAQLCQPHRPNLKQSDEVLWTEEYTKHFKTIKDKIAASTENNHYNPNLDVLVKCDASRSGL